MPSPNVTLAVSRWTCTAVLLVACCSLPALATEPVLFVGKCLSVHSFWAGKVVMTEARFQNLRSVSGKVPTLITLRTLGGRVNEPVPITALMPGGVLFSEVQTAVVVAELVSGVVFRVARKEQYHPVLFDQATGQAFIQAGSVTEPLESFLESLVKRIQSNWGASR